MAKLKTKHFWLVGNDKGGARKTMTATLLASTSASQSLPFHIYQTDKQGRLPKLFPKNVTTLEMPSTEQLRQDDTADAAALVPLDEALHNSSLEIDIFDIGANFPARVAEVLAATDTDAHLSSVGTPTTILIPITTESEAVILGARAMELLRAALPHARAVVVMCDDGNLFANIPDASAKRIFAKHFQPLIDAGNIIRQPRLLPRALSALEASGLTPVKFAELADAELLRITGLPGAVARQIRGDVAKFAYEAMQEVEKLLPFCDDRNA